MSDLIAFAGGGTGGHLFPGIALADELRRRSPETRVLFVGSDREVERRIMAEHGHPHVALPLAPLRHFWQRPARFLWKNGQALHLARRLIQRERPQVVMGLGGLTSAPLVWAAHRAGVPVLLLEQNAIPGRATRWLAPCARVICTSFSECIDLLPRNVPAITCGNPVRCEIAALAAEPAPSTCRKTLLVLGGSQGAQALNLAVLELVRQRRTEFADWTIIHQTGPQYAEFVRQVYCELHQPHEVAGFFANLTVHYRQADLVISRAGATTLAELACAGRPMVLVPFPQAADDHQRANAAAFVRQGAAAMVAQQPEAVNTARALWRALEPWWYNERLRVQVGEAARGLARPDATCRILELMREASRAAA